MVLHDGQALAWALIAKVRTLAHTLAQGVCRPHASSVSQAGRVLRAEAAGCRFKIALRKKIKNKSC